MSMFLCHACDNLREADYGCEEGPNNSLICQDCADEMPCCEDCGARFDNEGKVCVEATDQYGGLYCFECVEQERVEAEEAADRAAMISVGGHRDGGSAS